MRKLHVASVIETIQSFTKNRLSNRILNNKPAPKKTIVASEKVSTTLISITGSGFIPKTVKIKTGDTVTWTNTDSAPHQIASDPHPTHTAVPGLLGDPIDKNETFSFTYEKTGTFTYHDELNPLSITGTVEVD
jgi:plastocyanin